jgi:MFS family permease
MPAWTLFAGTFINRFGAFVLPFLVLYLTRRGMSEVQAGLALSLYGVGSVTAAFIGGYLADHVGRRTTIVISMWSSAVAMLALSRAESLPVLFALTFVAGLATELYRPASAALIADLTPPGQRVTAFAMYRLAINAGWALGPAVAGLLAERSFTLLFVIDAFTSAAFGAIAFFALPQGLRSSGGGVPRVRALPAILADAPFLRLLLATLAIAIAIFQSMSTVALHVRDAGHPAHVYGMLMSLNGVLIITLELALTTLTRRFPTRGVLALGVALTAGGFALTGLASSLPALAATLVVWTMGEMLFQPMAGAHVADLAPEAMRGRYQAAFGMCFSLGLVIAPTLGTALYSRSEALLWGMCALLGVASVGLILWRGERERGMVTTRNTGSSRVVEDGGTRVVSEGDGV